MRGKGKKGCKRTRSRHCDHIFFLDHMWLVTEILKVKVQAFSYVFVIQFCFSTMFWWLFPDNWWKKWFSILKEKKSAQVSLLGELGRWALCCKSKRAFVLCVIFSIAGKKERLTSDSRAEALLSFVSRFFQYPWPVDFNTLPLITYLAKYEYIFNSISLFFSSQRFTWQI